ncbi:ribonuclease H-like domain-containing protein [Tanacetum coccineum]|uniref:Ribonuclease H-like domain-containing protein n=1 Tax=Tanacetum coccineum TaxID=301880 RepID=A0ABQ5FMI1_9ASTR
MEKFHYGLCFTNSQERSGTTPSWVIVRSITKLHTFLPMREMTLMDKLARLYLKEGGHKNGIPVSIIYDRDPVYVKTFGRSLQKAMGTRWNMSNGLSYEDDGQAKDLQTLEDMLRAVHVKRGRDTKIPQSSGPPVKVGDEAVHKELGDRMERAATTASSLEAEQDSGSGPRCQDTILGDVDAQTRFETTSKQSNDPPLSRGYILGSGEDSLELLELMELCTKLSNKLHKNRKSDLVSQKK